MKLLLNISLKQLLARKRQSIVSLLGIILGVSFFLAVSGLMHGSEKDFIRRLVDNAPHITMLDEFRNPKLQALNKMYPTGAVELRNVQPITENRGIRGYNSILHSVRQATPGILASPVLVGQGLVTFAGKEFGVSLNGMIPSEMRSITTIKNYMLEGTIDELVTNSDGIIIGQELARRLSREIGDNLVVTSATGQIQIFKIVGIFRIGRADYDLRQTFVTLKRAQTLLNRPYRANNIIIKLPDPYQARTLAAKLEQTHSYKAISWQEASEDLLNTLAIRNTIMYTVVSAVLIVAAFGIYNVISTVVLEKQRDIAILKSIGFYKNDILAIFLIQGIVLGFVGIFIGLPLGSMLMVGLMQIKFKPPGGIEIINMPIAWHWMIFVIASTFALSASILAAFLPARKAATVEPVAILRGAQ